MKHRIYMLFSMLALTLLMSACSNNPYPEGESEGNTYFTAISHEVENLDPAVSYSSGDYILISQIYEPPFQYHYLKRPYEVIPLTAEEIPKPVFYDHNGSIINNEDPPPELISRVEYTVRIKKNILYADHPCFAKKKDGTPYYKGIAIDALKDCEYPSRLPEKGTRELKAKDYVLQMRRLADPRLPSPVFPKFSEYIIGLEDLSRDIEEKLSSERLRREAQASSNGRSYNKDRDEKENPIRIDYLSMNCPGIELIDDYTYKITLKRKYPQIIYWMCMPFCTAMPQEALDFFGEPAMISRNFNLSRCTVGSGPYLLDTFRPNEKIIMLRNDNYHDEYYPSEGEEGDREKGLLNDAGKKLPMIDKQVWMIEKEYFSIWLKFLQGYYDNSGISEEVFDQAVTRHGSETGLSDEMQEKGIIMHAMARSVLREIQFNMLDPVVGGLDEKQCKLRRAINIAMDYNEFLDVFRNGRGIIAAGPLPPGIFGHRSGPEGVNPYTQIWDEARQSYRVKPIEDAQKLMSEAGYPNGIGPDGKQLTLYLDHGMGGDTTFKSYVQWFTRKFEKLGIRLEERGTDPKQLYEKKLSGNWQITLGGWGADYPDPENFLFMYFGPNSQAKANGVNFCNYENKEYDALFSKMENMLNTPERLDLIDRMIEILRHDAPSVWTTYDITFALQHGWLHNVKPHDMTHNTAKYRRINSKARAAAQQQWNNPVYWPVAVISTGLLLLLLPAAIQAWRRERGL